MFKFIENIGDYFATNFFDEDFKSSVFNKSGYSQDDLKEITKNTAQLKDKYFKYKTQFLDLRRPKDKIKATHEFHTELLNILGYEGSKNDYHDLLPVNDKHVIPVRNRYFKGDKPHLFVMEMQSMIQVGEETPKGLFEQRYSEDEEESNGRPQSYHRSQWEYVFQVPDEITISPSIINEAITEIFLLDQLIRPEYIMLLAGNEVYLLQSDKWSKGSYLRFNIEHLFDESSLNRDYYSLFYLLLGKKLISPESDVVLMEQLDEESHKRAYAVTEDLKLGIIHAVEELANEAVWYFNDKSICQDEMKEANFAQLIKDDCLTMVYRLLFVFYAESRPDLEILPVTDEVYERGYSLEMLRDLEKVHLGSETARSGYFFHDSLFQLFSLLNTGYKSSQEKNKSFEVIRLDTPLFDNNKLHFLQLAKFRNIVWQRIIERLSIVKDKKRKTAGRISYANLGINQLGSVYEGLLSYKGFFAEQDYIEVKKASDSTGKDGTWVVPRIRRGDFEEAEIVKNPEDESKDLVIEKGKFIYRLSGRDRQKSASYYTPEVLTRTTVKYTLKPILEQVEDGKLKALDLLDLKILEPAMGAAAFHNEVINQLAASYLEYRQKETKQKVSPGRYQEEFQKVKAYIATNNVYGVDINPTAIELGKLSLWLNVIHKSMETPFFGYRLGVGNAVVGAWLKVYSVQDINIEYPKEGTQRERNTPIKKEWWTTAPKELKFKTDKSINRKENEIYHFLLPDKNMVPSAGIKLLKDEFAAEAKRVSEWRNEFCKPFRGHEITHLKTICTAIDQLLDEHYQFNSVINSYSQDKSNIWGKDPVQLSTHSYNEKEELAQQRDKNSSPYFKLKAIMDYWCALWFWDIRDAKELPSREDYLKDISQILDIDLSELTNLPEEDWVQDNKPRQTNLFEQATQQKLKQFQQQKQGTVTIDAIQHYTNRTQLWSNIRITLIKQYADNYRFFHYQLEFIEVFKDRGGFDVAVGNPPWLKIQFEEKGLMSEVFPEMVIRKTTAPQIRKMQKSFLELEENKAIYFSENIETESISIFMNAIQNYPLLIGQQTNLYKCILENGLHWISQYGFLGLIHPEGIYDDPNGTIAREVIYRKLKYHFHFRNGLFLFPEVHDQVTFSINVYSGKMTNPDFVSISNIFSPQMIDGCFSHYGSNLCGGIKIKDNRTQNFVWNINPHKSRIVHFSDKELKILSSTFEEDSPWTCAKLVNIHAKEIFSILEKFSKFPQRIQNFETKITVCWDETNDTNAGNIERKTKYPNLDLFEMIYSGPHFYVSNPLYKTPQEVCKLNSHYDIIDHTKIDESYIARTNYTPQNVSAGYIDLIKGFKIKGDSSYDAKYDSWLNYYKLGFRKMLGQPNERTLIPSILLPKAAHIHGVISIIFKNEKQLIECAGLTSSILLDFFIKTIGAANLADNRIQSFPLGIEGTFVPGLYVRTLMLNCINKYYSDLWKENWEASYVNDQWSIKDERLKPFNNLTKEWQWSIPLRNWFERRQALVEIDVISAMALGLNLDELILIYNVQFPVLQQNEDDTWYDQKGNIVFTCSKGLSGVGLDRPEWEQVKNNKEGELVKHTITKSELYQGKEVTYYPPFDKCDRVEDYKVAWKHFEGVFKEEK